MSESLFTGERLPGGGDEEFSVDMERHLAAYRWAAEQVRDRRVLDAGCGEGYGTALLAEGTREIVGMDRREAVEVARARHQRAGLEYRIGDLTRLAELSERFDAVLSFQVIEHLEDPLEFLRGLASVTAPGGTILVTTPNRLMSVSENPYHLREWTAPELLELARPALPSARMLGIHGSERVRAYEQARGEQVARILRLDPLGIRHLLPTAIVHGVFPRLARLVRRRIASSGSMPTADPADFSVSDQDLEHALDLALIATV